MGIKEAELVIYTAEYYSSFEGGLLAFVTAWMNLQDIVMGKTSQAQKDKEDMTSFLGRILRRKPSQIASRMVGQQSKVGVGNGTRESIEDSFPVIYNV